MKDVPPFPNTFQIPLPEMYAGMLLYSLRLNPTARGRIEQILADSLPCDFDPQRTISLPIRGSDKCLLGDMHLGANSGETDCLDFPTYMEGAELIRSQDPKVWNLVSNDGIIWLSTSLSAMHVCGIWRDGR